MTEQSQATGDMQIVVDVIGCRKCECMIGLLRSGDYCAWWLSGYCIQPSFQEISQLLLLGMLLLACDISMISLIDFDL